MFYIGQKVICIDDTVVTGDVRGFSAWVVKGSIYIIRDIAPPDPFGGGFLLEEITADIHQPSGIEYGWRITRFRQLDERKTDISIFRELLNPTPQQRRELIGHDLGFTKEEIGVE
jgi:hypothetical protein